MTQREAEMMIRRNSLLGTTGLLAVAVMAASGSAFAAGSGTAVLEEIVVTAQKRAERLQEVPIAVTAILGADMDAKQIINLEDIRNLVPNLYMEQALTGTTTPKMYLRGVGVVNQVFSFDSPIGIYFDGVYISRVTGALIDLFDVERVEFLRGPQGTLFGRNSSVGALRVINKLPTLDASEVHAELAYGTKDQINGRFVMSAPIIEDKLALRVTFLSRTNDGFQTDLTTGESFMDNNINAGRVALLFQASDNVQVILRGDYMADHSKPTQGSNFRINPDNDIFTFESSPGTRFVNQVEPWGVSATINANLASIDITSITAYRGLRYRNANDVDGRADVESFQVDRQDLNEWQFSQEVFASSDHLANMALEWTAGLFYLHEKNDFRWALRIFAPPTTQFFNQATDTFAGYAQAALPVTDRLKLTGGLRYTYEKKALVATQNLADGTPNVGFRFDNSITAKKVNWHAAGDYKLSDDVMIYVTAGTGFRSGGFNGSARDVASILSGSFGPETTITVEGGAKTEWFDRRLRLNVDYFYTDYSNLQQAVTRSDGTITTSNVGATVKGIEAELTAVPIDGLEISGTLGTLDDNIKDSNKQLAVTPSLQWRLGAIYTLALGNAAGSIRIGGDVSHTASYFNNTDNTPTTMVPAYELYNAQIAYITEDERWEFKFSGTNLSDHVFAAHTFDIAGGFISSVKFPSTPRRWLFTVTYRN
jgi:iron complex outermembrane receptor protein